MKKTTSILMLLAMLTAGVQTAFTQTDSRDYNRGWYAGLSGGTSFRQATFRSITESKTNVGAQFGVFGGYQLSRLFSVEAIATMGGRPQRARTPLSPCFPASYPLFAGSFSPFARLILFRKPRSLTPCIIVLRQDIASDAARNRHYFQDFQAITKLFVTFFCFGRQNRNKMCNFVAKYCQSS